MYLVRDIFTTKPGKAKDLVAKFKAMGPHLTGPGTTVPPSLTIRRDAPVL